MQDEVLTVVGKVGLSAREICGGIIIGPSCGHFYDPWHQNWSIAIPLNKPPVKPVPLPKVSIQSYHAGGSTETIEESDIGAWVTRDFKTVLDIRNIS